MIRPPGVRRSLRILIASEVFGVEVFSRVERHAHSAADRELWAALHGLERQTRQAVFARLPEEVRSLRPTLGLAGFIGAGGGRAMPSLPRHLQLRSVVMGTQPFLPHFRRLQEHFSGTPEAPFYDYIVAHELAIAELGRRALLRHDDPATVVDVLMGRVPD